MFSSSFSITLPNIRKYFPGIYFSGIHFPWNSLSKRNSLSCKQTEPKSPLIMSFDSSMHSALETNFSVLVPFLLVEVLFVPILAFPTSFFNLYTCKARGTWHYSSSLKPYLLQGIDHLQWWNFESYFQPFPSDFFSQKNLAFHMHSYHIYGLPLTCSAASRHPIHILVGELFSIFITQYPWVVTDKMNLLV